MLFLIILNSLFTDSLHFLSVFTHGFIQLFFNVMNQIKTINQVWLGVITSINRNFFLRKKKTFLRQKTFFLEKKWTLRLKIKQVVKIYWNTIDNFGNFTVDLICSHKLIDFFFTWPRIWIVGNKSFKKSKYNNLYCYQICLILNLWMLKLNNFM